MTYEIEKRSLFRSNVDFDKCHNYIKNHAKFVGKYVFKSFLFRSPRHLRIRLSKDSKTAIITRKSGTYHDAARKEHNQTIELIALNKYLKKIKTEGFKECVCFKTISYAYELDGLRIDFNKITYLGMIVEVEAFTRDKSKISDLRQKVSDIMDRLNLSELHPDTYQKMMNGAYNKGLKPVYKHNFSV